MPEKYQTEQKELSGEVVSSHSSDSVITGRFEDAVRLLKSGVNAPLFDAQYENSNDTGLVPTSVQQSDHDGYPIPSVVLNPGGLPLDEFARNLVARKRQRKAA